MTPNSVLYPSLLTVAQAALKMPDTNQGSPRGLMFGPLLFTACFYYDLPMVPFS